MFLQLSNVHRAALCIQLYKKAKYALTLYFVTDAYSFWHYQADNLRQQTLQQLHRVLTTRQSARALLGINDYFSRLRALSSLWLARPRE